MLHPIRSTVVTAAAWAAILFATGLLWTGCGRAPEAPVDERSGNARVEASEPDSAATPPYYRVVGRGGATLILLGTIHVGPEAGWTLSPAIDASIASADRILLEVDLRLATEDRVSSLMAELAFLPPGRQITDVIAPETAKLLEAEDATITRLGVPPGQRRLMKPWLVSMILGESIYSERGLSPAAALEYRILEQLGDRPLVGLESFEEQLRLFDGLPPKLQDVMLRETLMSLDESGQLVDDLVRAWRAGDEAELARIAREGIDELPELGPFYDIVLGNRNRSWLAQLRPLLDGRAHAEESVLVAVGALHLVGRDSLVEQLRTAGYRVEKLSQGEDVR